MSEILRKHISIYIDKVELQKKTKELAEKYGCHRNWIVRVSKNVGFYIVTDPLYKQVYRELKNAHS